MTRPQNRMLCVALSIIKKGGRRAKRRTLNDEDEDEEFDLVRASFLVNFRSSFSVQNVLF